MLKLHLVNDHRGDVNLQGIRAKQFAAIDELLQRLRYSTGKRCTDTYIAGPDMLTLVV